MIKRKQCNNCPINRCPDCGDVETQDMAKRAERRHHEERVKAKFKKVVKKQTEWMQDPSRLEWKKENGVITRKRILDRTLPVKRLQSIEKQGAKMAHHPRHQCCICKLGPKEAKQKHEFEANKKKPFKKGIIDE